MIITQIRPGIFISLPSWRTCSPLKNKRIRLAPMQKRWISSISSLHLSLPLFSFPPLVKDLRFSDPRRSNRTAHTQKTKINNEFKKKLQEERKAPTPTWQCLCFFSVFFLIKAPLRRHCFQINTPKRNASTKKIPIAFEWSDFSARVFARFSFSPRNAMRAGRFQHIVPCLRAFLRGSETLIAHIIIRLSDIHEKKLTKKQTKYKQNKRSFNKKELGRHDYSHVSGSSAPRKRFNAQFVIIS